MTNVPIEARIGRENAQQSAVAARHLGLTMPQRLADLDAQRSELRRLAALPLLDLPLPDKNPKLIEKQLRDHATAMVQFAALVPTAATLADRVDGLASAVVREAVPGWCAELVDRFDTELAAFVEASTVAPFDAIAGHEGPEQVAAYMTATRTATLLDSLVSYRSLFGSTANEQHARPTDLWLIADVVTVMPEDHAAFMAAWRPLSARVDELTDSTHRPVMTPVGRMQDLPAVAPSAAARWRRLIQDPVLEVGLARFGEAEQRYERHQSRVAAAWAMNNVNATVKTQFAEHVARANARPTKAGAR